MPMLKMEVTCMRHKAHDLCDCYATSSSIAEYSPIDKIPSFDQADVVKATELFKTLRSAKSASKKLKRRDSSNLLGRDSYQQ